LVGKVVKFLLSDASNGSLMQLIWRDSCVIVTCIKLENSKLESDLWEIEEKEEEKMTKKEKWEVGNHAFNTLSDY
jgi:hypothetical protein